MLLNVFIGSASIALLVARVIKELCDDNVVPGIATEEVTAKNRLPDRGSTDNTTVAGLAAKKITTKKHVTAIDIDEQNVPENNTAENHVTKNDVTKNDVTKNHVPRPVASQVAHFDGQTQYIEIPVSFPDITNQVTIEFWAKGGAGLPQASTVFSAHDSARHRVFNIHLPWKNGKLYWDSGNSGTRFDRAQKTLAPKDYKDTWVHWAFIKNVDRGVMCIYKNGELWHRGRQKKRTLDGKNIRTVTIGAFGDGAGHYKWSGALAELRVWSRVLTPKEILAGMAIRATGKTAKDGLVAYWPLNRPLTEASGVTINNVGFTDATDLPLMREDES